MHPPDLYTLVYIIAAISLLFAVLMLFFYRATPNTKGPLHWSLGSFSAVISAFLFGAFPLFDGLISIVISSGFTILTVGLYWAGIRAFKGLPVDYKIIAALIFAQLLISFFFYSVWPLPNVRMGLFSVMSILVCLLAISELIKPIEKPYRVAFALCTLVFSISVITSVYRLVTIILTKPELPIAPTKANLTFYFLLSITQSLLLFAFVSLISLRISEQLKRKVESQRKFYSIIAHDLNGPVGMINVMLNMVNQDEDIDLREKIKISKEAESLSLSTHHLLQNLLIWSRNQFEDLEPHASKFDLDKLIVRNIGFLVHIANSKNITLRYKPYPELFCYADEEMIGTIIRNLISNAIKFSHSGGCIVISSEKSEDKVLVKVTDNGMGMSEKVQKNLFIFKENNTTPGTTGERGTGLGLMLCKEFVEGNKGSIIIKSQENVGTEVLIQLPSV